MHLFLEKSGQIFADSEISWKERGKSKNLERSGHFRIYVYATAAKYYDT